MAIFIVVTKCTLSTLTGKNAKESEGILDFPLCTTMDQWKTNIFSSRGCIVSPYVVVLQMNSVSSWVQLKAFVLALSCRCRFTIKLRGRKWRGGVWVWHKQEMSFVFLLAPWCTQKVYSKLCVFPGYFVGFARSLHNKHWWEISTY